MSRRRRRMSSPTGCDRHHPQLLLIPSAVARLPTEEEVDMSVSLKHVGDKNIVQGQVDEHACVYSSVRMSAEYTFGEYIRQTELRAVAYLGACLSSER